VQHFSYKHPTLALFGVALSRHHRVRALCAIRLQQSSIRIYGRQFIRLSIKSMLISGYSSNSAIGA
jgi:uncharacterized ubiquitin-like protein YukD